MCDWVETGNSCTPGPRPGRRKAGKFTDVPAENQNPARTAAPLRGASPRGRPGPSGRGVPVRVLGIETSCHETAVALYEGGRGLLAHRVYTQTDLHEIWGGVVPELA